MIIMLPVSCCADVSVSRKHLAQCFRSSVQHHVVTSLTSLTVTWLLSLERRFLASNFMFITVQRCSDDTSLAAGFIFTYFEALRCEILLLTLQEQQRKQSENSVSAGVKSDSSDCVSFRLQRLTSQSETADKHEKLLWSFSTLSSDQMQKQISALTLNIKMLFFFFSF